MKAIWKFVKWLFRAVFRFMCGGGVERSESPDVWWRCAFPSQRGIMLIMERSL